MQNFTERLLQNETLDDFGLKGEALHRTLRELKKINFLLFNTYAITKAVLSSIKSINQTQITLVDLGCGGGDIVIHLASVLKKKGIKAKLIGIDGNPHSMDYASRLAKDFTNVEFITADLFDAQFIFPNCDIMISSHFMYHFEEEKMIHFINKHLHQINHSIIVSELIRNSISYFLFQLASPFLRLGKIAKEDGLTAIKRAFTFRELDDLARHINTESYNHYRSFFFRQLVVFRKVSKKN